MLDLKNQNHLASIFIFTTSILLRLVFCWEIYDTPFFSGLIGDASLFDSWAQEIAGGKWSGEHVILQPFYPYFLAAIYFIFSHDLLAVRIIQIILGALSCVIIQRAGYYFFSRRVGILAGFLLACYPSAVFFDCLIQKSVFGMFFISLLLLLVGKIMNEQRYSWWFFVGVVMGLLILVRENAAILFPAVVLWSLIHFWHQSKRRLVAYLIMMTTGIFIVFLPVGLKNKFNTGKFSVGASHFGPNLYMGNNLKAKGIYVPLAIGRGNIVSELEDITEIAEKDRGKKLTPNEVSDYWVEKTLAYIKSNPVHWIKLLMKKWFLVWNVIEIGDTVDIYGCAQHSRVLWVVNKICHLGILFPLAVLGICVTFKDRERLWLLYLMMIAYAASLTVFFVFARYRFPMAAIVILFASAGIFYSYNFFSKKTLKTTVFVGSIVLCSIFISNWRIIPEGISSATTYYNLAKLYEGGREQSNAIKYYEAALKIVPDFSLAHNNLGVILINYGQYNKAIHHFNQAISAEPNFADAHNNLGAALSSSKRLSEAIIQFEKALMINPDDASIHNNLGIALFKDGQFNEAFNHFQRAHQLSPDNADIARNLQKVTEQVKAIGTTQN